MIERLSVLGSGATVTVTSSQLAETAAFFAALLLAERPLALPKPTVGRGAGGTASVEEHFSLRRPDEDKAPMALRNLHGQAIGPKGAKTRLRLMRATTELLAEGSLMQISVNDVARKAGTSKSVFTAYFRDVLDVVRVSVADLTQSTPELMKILNAKWNSPTRGDLSERFVRNYIESRRRNGALFKVRNVMADEGDVDFSRARLRALNPMLEVIARKFAARQEAGGEPRHLHPLAAAGGFLAMMERIATTPVLGAIEGVSSRSIEHAAAFFLAVLLSGVEPKTLTAGAV
jgi:AcrR family transcriptional regulator